MPTLEVITRRLPYFHPQSFPDNPGVPFHDPGGQGLRILPLYQLLVKMLILPKASMDIPMALNGSDVEAIIDTGSPLTVFPFSVWPRYESSIIWLDQPEHVNRQGDTILPSLNIVGGTFPYRLGRIRLGFRDLAGDWFSSEITTCFFLMPASQTTIAAKVIREPSRVILGLRSPILLDANLKHSRKKQSWQIVR